MKQIETIRNKVVEVLRNSPKARDNDWWLLINYIQTHHPEARLFINYNEISNLPMPESIRRVRQKIQNEERLYSASEQASLSRSIEEVRVRNWSTSEY